MSGKKNSIEFLLMPETLSGNKLCRVLSLGAGILVSCAIFYGIIQVQKTKTVHNVLVFDELKTVILPSPPVPPPRFEKTEEPPPPSLLEMEPNATESTIEIAYHPQKHFQPVKPKYEPQVDFNLEAFKPGLKTSSSRTVYEKHEVNQAPIAVYKKIPQISSYLLRRIDIPRVVLMYIVNTDGSVENVNLLGSADPEFDKIILEAVAKWRFKPAVKDGKDVRCWIKQGVTVKMGAGNPFITY